MTLRSQAALLLVAVSVLIGSGLIATGAVSSSVEQLAAAASLAREQEETVEDLISLVQQAEAGALGYLLSERPGDLAPYREASLRVPPLLAQLDHVAAGTGWLQPQAAQLRMLVEQQVAELGLTLRTADIDGFPAARVALMNGPERQQMEQAQALAAGIADRAELERNAHARKLQTRHRTVSIAALLSLLGGLVLLGIAGLRLLWIRTALLRARQGERREAERLAATVEHIRDGVAVFDPRGRLVLQNARFASVLGLAAPPARLTTLEEVAAAAPGVAGLAGPPPLAGPVMVEARQGARALEIWRSSMPGGGQIVAASDISRRVQAEAIARQAQKMEALGQMTGGIAHDFNNLLQVVSGNLELLSGRLARADEDPDVRERLAAASTAVASGAQLTRSLLAFARRQPLAPETLDPARLLLSMEDMLRRTVGAGVELKLVIGAGLWPMRADPGQMESALLNLTLNARDAMVRESGIPSGRLTIEVGNADLPDRHLIPGQDGDVAPGQYVAFAVIDTGAGMSKEQLGRALEPFYTTKPEGKGTGLGLPMVLGFAKQSGGHLLLSSEPGRGTAARLYLPRTAERAGAAAPAPDAPAGHGELVLVVEDDRSVREVAASALRALGYAVREAASPDEALALLQSGLSPSALFTDVVMPGAMSARELAAAARAMFPSLAVLFTSGYTRETMLREDGLGTGVALLSKPWRTEELGRALRDGLEAASCLHGGRCRRRVLLVEDDKMIRETAADVLTESGFDVVEAADGAAALSRLYPPPDVLITDLGLPDMDGHEVVRRVREALPGLPVVVATGRLDVPQTGVVVLPKPFDRRALMGAVVAALRGAEKPDRRNLPVVTAAI